MNGGPRNAFGPNPPVDDAARIVELFGIRPGDRVLEVGGAANPFPRADVVCDLTFGATHQRNGAPGVFRPGVEYVEASAESLPFPDGAFDFVWCTQVLEHVPDPVAAARELSRVARRGFVELPSRVGEMMNGNPTHRWVVDREGDVLVFHPRTFVEHPFDNLLYAHLFRDTAFRRRCDHAFRNVLNHQVLFEGTLHVRVMPTEEPVFDYEDREQAARAHHSFARHCLAAGAEVTYALPDALEAYRLVPDRPETRFLYACYLARLLQFDDALRVLGDEQEMSVAALRRVIERARAGEPVDLDHLPPSPPLPAGLPPIRDGGDRPPVSLVIPAPDVRGLRDAVESALAQDYPLVEAVVATCAPEAEVAAVLAPFSGIARLRVVRVEGGVDEVRLLQEGFGAARGTLIGVVLPGDRLMAQHVDRLASDLYASGAGAVYGNVVMLDGSGVFVPKLSPGNPGGAAFPLSCLLARDSALMAGGPIRAGEPHALSEWLARFARRAVPRHVPVATVMSSRPVDAGAHVIEAARAALDLRPLDLYRELLAAHERIRALEGRLGPGT